MSRSKSFFRKTCIFTNTALKKAQGFIEISQLNLKISGLKSRVERKFAMIGALVVSKKNGCLKKLTEEQCNEKIDKLCCDVSKLKQKIKKVKAEVEEIKSHIKNCSFCCESFDECDDCDDFVDCGDCCDSDKCELEKKSLEKCDSDRTEFADEPGVD